MGNWNFVFSTKIVSGVGSLERVGEELKQFNSKYAMVVTDPIIVKTATVDTVISSLRQADIESVIFSQVESDPTMENAENAVQIVMSENCDCIVAVGGGSAIDVAKATAILAKNPGPLRIYEGADKIPARPLPIFAIPTTAGTGSEVSQSAILRDGNTKRSIRSVWLTPKVAFLDPAAVATAPFQVAVNSGLDALAHNLEAYVSRWASPMTDMLAETGLKLIAENLLPYCANPQNAVAANHMQVAALLGAAAFANSRVGLPHALGMAVGGIAHLPHGLACGISLPPCVEFSYIAAPLKYRRITDLLGIRVEGLTDEAVAKALVKYLVNLLQSLETKADLKSYGITEDQIDVIVAEMLRPGLHTTDPRSITMEQAHHLVCRAFHFSV